MSSILSYLIMRCPSYDVYVTYYFHGLISFGKYLDISGLTLGSINDPSKGALDSNLTPIKS